MASPSRSIASKAIGWSSPIPRMPPADEGKGFAARLVGAALADARKRGFKIVPACSYIVAYVRRHPEYDDHS